MTTIQAAEALRAALMQRQDSEKLTDEAMAAALGVSRQSWNFLSNDRRPLTFRIAAGAAVAFPDLAPLANRVFLTLKAHRIANMPIEGLSSRGRKRRVS